MARSPFSTPRVLNALSSPLAASSSLDAGEPFADPDADLVLRSVDAVDFKVHKLFMTKAFDFFDDMFTIGDAEGHETRDGLPVITLSENASTLESVLRLVYAIDNPELYDLSQLRDVCAALDKYSVRHFPTAVVDALCRAASSHPEIVYALGCRYNIPRVVELAARQTLRNPRQLATVPKADLFYVSDAQRHALLLFQQECIARAAEVAANITWLHMSAIPGVASHGRHPPNCSCWRKYTEVRGGHAVFEEVRNVLVAIPEWCLDYLESVSNALRHGAYASGRAAISPQMLEFALRSAAGCSFCQESAHGRLFSFALTLQAEIDKRVSMVPFPPN